MIGLIGFKRILVLLALLGMNLLVAGGYYFGLAPMLVEARTQLTAADGQISELSGKIANIKQELAYLKDNMPGYQALLARGIVQDQDRFRIGHLLDDMRDKAKLSSFSFVIDDTKDVPNADAADSGYRLASSRINISIVAAPLDSRIYAFLQGIGDTFPGHTHIQSFNIQRTAEVNKAALQDIAEGKPAGFLNANVVFDWMTMIPKTAAQPAASEAAGAGAPAGFRGR